MLYCYRVEPLHPAFIMIGVVLVITAVVPDVWRGLIAIFLSGPVVWLLLQLLRRRVGVTLHNGQLEVRSSVTRLVRSIPLIQIRAVLILPDQRVVLSYLQPRPNMPGDPDPRPPRQRVFVTAALDDAPALAAALPAVTIAKSDLTSTQLQRLLRARRVRRLIYSALVIMVGIPVIIGIVLRIFSSLGLFNVSSF